MNLTSEHPYWTTKNGLIANFPALSSDTECDVAVLGAGITGALMAEALSADGHDVVVLDARDVCHGSTSASTALLQYEVDTHLVDLIERHGQDRAAASYLACYESIDMLELRIRDLGLSDCGFTRKDSVYLASTQKDVAALQKEASARRSIGIEVEEWSEKEVREKFGFSRPLALRSRQGAEVDAYRLAQGMLGAAQKRGVRIYDRTKVSGVEIDRLGVELSTERGPKVRAKYLVVASGYESEELFDTGNCVSLHSSFALATEPLTASGRWWKDCLLWESARPYFYLRTDTEGRAILGGEDVPFRSPTARDKLIPKKIEALEKRYREMFPHSPMEVAYGWAGTFGETEDGLAYIGAHPKYPKCLFALGFGGNGITYSVIATEILRNLLASKPYRYSETFSFGR